MKSETITNLVTATIKVMQAVKGIDKNMEIGTGQNAYKGVKDQDVKEAIGKAMAENGLAIFPIEIEDSTEVSSWDENQGQYSKRKQSVFTKVKVKYLLTHESGEFMQIAGYGHGVDSQDKSAGKATTYALKYALLYTFLVPTGKIADADNDHSDRKDVPPEQKPEVKDAVLTEDQERRLVEEILALEGCTTRKEVADIWGRNADLQTNKVFTKSVGDQVEKLKNAK